MADLHQGQPVLHMGEALEQAKAAMILIHGRGATAESILTLIPEINQPGFAYLAPQAARQTWYPNRFLDPIPNNEPYLSSALKVLEDLLAKVNQAGIPSEHVVLLGFSQGGCLTLEFAARHARRFGALVGLSAGLIGPENTPRDYPGSLAGTPVYLGCSDVDFHVPKERVHESAQVLQKLGGVVTERLFPNMEHTINEEELSAVRDLMASVINQPQP